MLWTESFISCGVAQLHSLGCLSYLERMHLNGEINSDSRLEFKSAASIPLQLQEYFKRRARFLMWSDVTQCGDEDEELDECYGEDLAYLLRNAEWEVTETNAYPNPNTGNWIKVWVATVPSS